MLTQRIALALILTLAAHVHAHAGAPAPPGDKASDYSHLLPLNVAASQAVVQLRLPRAVYLAARSPRLDDLRVFDAAGAPMPYALVDLAPQTSVSRPSAPVAVFPVHGPARAGVSVQEGLQIRTGSDGALISVTAPARAAGDELISLVLDLQPAARAAKVGAGAAIGALSLTLPPGAGSYNADIALDVSDNLQDWEELAEAAVSWLVNSQGASVQKHRIDFAPRRFRYARLRWLDGKPIEFAAIHAEYVVQREAGRQVETLVLQGEPGSEARDLIYTAPVAIPVASVGLVFQGRNVVMPVMIGQYQAMPSRDPGARTVLKLQPLINTTFFQLEQDGRRRASGDVAVPLTHAARWVVRPLNAAPEQPALRLGWEASTIVFFASGKAPYHLAFGRDGAPPAGVGLHQVAPGFSERELTALTPATPGEVIVQNRLEQDADSRERGSAAGNKQVWLWALLAGGVAALAGMAWHLLRQLKGGASEPPPSA